MVHPRNALRRSGDSTTVRPPVLAAGLRVQINVRPAIKASRLAPTAAQTAIDVNTTAVRVPAPHLGPGAIEDEHGEHAAQAWCARGNLLRPDGRSNRRGEDKRQHNGAQNDMHGRPRREQTLTFATASSGRSRTRVHHGVDAEGQKQQERRPVGYGVGGAAITGSGTWLLMAGTDRK
jgi:hypothetical protein